jgi:ferrous iron transport protein A
MMPLSMSGVGEEKLIKKIGGKSDTKKLLEKLGFVQGCPVTIVSKISGNVIVSLRESRVAISREMANKIMV